MRFISARVSGLLNESVSLPQSAPWLVSVCAAFWQSGRCPPPLRNASSPGQYSEWWRHLSAPHQHYSGEGKHLIGWLVFSVSELGQFWPTYCTRYAIKCILYCIIISTLISFTMSRDYDEPHCLPAVNADWSILAKLLLGFVHLANEIDEALPWFGHTLLRPVSELELTHCPWLAILREWGNDETYQDVDLWNE